MPEKRLVIFDLDNTLVVNRPAAKAAYEAALRFLAKETKSDYEKIHNHWKRIIQRLQTEAAPEKRAFEYSLTILATDHQMSDKFIPLALKMFEKELLANIRPMPGAKELVSWLKEEGSLVAISSATDRTLAKKKLKKCELYDLVDMILTSSDVGQMKPHGDYYRMILTELKIRPDQTVVVGDSKKEDIEPAKSMGIKTIEIPSQNPQLTALKPVLSEFLSFAK